MFYMNFIHTVIKTSEIINNGLINKNPGNMAGVC